MGGDYQCRPDDPPLGPANRPGSSAVHRAHGPGGLCHLRGGDGSRLVTLGYDHTARLWDTATGAQLAAMPLGAGIWIGPARWFPDLDGRIRYLLASGATASGVQVWDLVTGQKKAFVPGTFDTGYISPDGTALLTGTAAGGLAQLWDAATGVLRREFKGLGNQVTNATLAGRPDRRRSGRRRHRAPLGCRDGGRGPSPGRKRRGGLLQPLLVRRPLAVNLQ